MARDIDHLVLPVASLEQARARYSALGFFVNADGIHPFGTKNCCVFFENGTYLEPLAIHQLAVVNEHLGINSFVALDDRFRKAYGNEGFSAVALQTDDAVADEKIFQAADLAGVSMLSFSRKAVHADGSEDLLKVDGAFCIREKHDALAFFTCNWLGNQDVVRKIKKAGPHSNNISGVIGVSLVSNRLDVDLSYLSTAFGAEFEKAETDLYRLSTPYSTITLSTPAYYHHQTGEPVSVETLTAPAFTLAAPDIGHIQNTLIASNIVFKIYDDKIIIPPAPGQGATIIIQQQAH